MDNKNTGLKTEANSIFAKIAGVMAFLLLFVFPLYVEDRYANILRAKYHFYYIVVLAALAIILIMALIFMFIDMMENGGAGTKEFFAKFKPGNWRKTFHIYDFALIGFMLTAVISSMQSEYLYESVWGNEGRFSGSFLLCVYGISFFLLSRFLKFKKWYLDAFLIASNLVCILGITDYFRLDILHLKRGLDAFYDSIFTSTFGNINTYTAFVALFLGVAVVLFISAGTKRSVAWYYISSIIAITGGITGISDNFYIALAIVFGFLPFYAFGSKKGIQRYFVLIATTLTVIRILGVLDVTMRGIEYGQVIGLDSLAKYVGHFRGTTIIAATLWICIAVIYYRNLKRSKLEIVGDYAGKWPKRIWGAFVIVAALMIAAVVYDANIVGNEARYGSVANYLIFDDDWGTARGYAWRFAMEIYNQFPILHKLFGYGADTFGILAVNYTGETASKMYDTYKQIYDSVHNAYLQYLVTIGAVGLITYLVFICSAGFCIVKKAVQNPCAMACFFGIACYAGQAIVNIDLPAVTPAFWTLLAVGIASVEMKIKEEKQQN